MTETARHKRIRLDRDVYAQTGYVCSITVATVARRALFTEPALATIVVEVLKQRAEATGVRVYAYCLMPDHLHLLLSPSESCNIIDFVGGVKSLSQRQLRYAGVQGTVWQKSFYDRFLRREEDIPIAVKYVLANPFREGLVDDWHKYPYSGSQTGGVIQN